MYRGRILDAGGKPVAGAQLRLIAARDRPADDRQKFPFNWAMIQSGQIASQPKVIRFLEAVSDGEGAFAFAQVPSKCEVELAWWGRGVVPGRSDHLERLDDTGSDSLRIVTPAPARIVGTWDRREFPDAARIQVSSPAGFELLGHDQELKPGQHEFAVGDLAPGTYQVSIMGPYTRVGNDGMITSRSLALRNVVVESGETRRVEFKK
jgi:hypothetical protein